ncbi:MAG: AAA family ATPase [Gammaproteobacteria bacterium]|nr:AAA family ATPase [Gammaproteobacteria bacterium]
MIIHRIKAKNVLKYTSLELDDLPERGLIAITGPNESGKSTIGETLCFGLFGRTFSLDYDDLDKVICWGETHCSAVIDFTASDGKRYTMERFLDDSGNHSARLIKADAVADEEPLARGVEKVADLVYDLIGYEYEEFIESFYLAQREITTPHPHSYAVKTMAGLVTLEYSAAAFREEVEGTQAALQESQQEDANLKEQIDGFKLDPDCMPGLEKEHADNTALLADANRQLSDLDQASVEYQDALPKRESALQARSTAGFLRFLFLMFALLSGGAWVLLSKLPEHELAVDLHNTLSGFFSGWNADMVNWLLYGAGGFLVLFILFWIRRSGQNRQLRLLADAGRELSSVLDGLETESLLQAAAKPRQPEDTQETDSALQSEEASVEETEPSIEVVDGSAREKLSQRVAELQADFAEVREGVGREQGLLRQVISRIQERITQLEGEITQEQSRIQQIKALQAMRDDLVKKHGKHQHYVERCELAGELLQGAMREVSFQFNQKIRGLVSKTLPLFTENRYEHLQIDDDLTVRAFSSEKRDFMDLEEISSGTQRQIMLAVRLALSQELVGRTVKSDQFLFLDEPFAFFDQARTRSSLKVLPDISEQLTQIWIIGQEFPQDLQFDRHIKCDREFQSIS